MSHGMGGRGGRKCLKKCHLLFESNDPKLLVSVMHVISTTAPDPLFSEVLWPLGLRASAGGELAVSAASRNAVNNSGRGDSVSKSGLL
jgi:hypothetical protein